jgi:hypothetical protein
MLGDTGYSCDMRLKKSDMVLWIGVFVVTALLLVPLPPIGAILHWPALVAELENFGHPLAFAWLAHLAHGRLRWQWVLALAAGYGGAIELIQPLTHRDASVSDAVNDVLGAGFMLLLHAGRQESTSFRRRGLIGLAAVTGIAVATPLAITIAAYINRSVQAPVLWSDRSALFKRFSYWQESVYPGLAVAEPLPDWRDWGFLEVEVENLRSQPLPVVVRVHDRLHDQTDRDRYNGGFTLTPQGHHTLRIPLDLIRKAPAKRQMDLSAIRGIMVFGFREPGTQTPSFHVTEIRLTR